MPAAPPVLAALFAWLHLVAAGVGAGLLITEYWLCRRPPDRMQAGILGLVDLGYGLALIATLATGLARAFHDGQTADNYLSNRLFLLKMAVFLVIAAVAVVPSLTYLRWNREARREPIFAPLPRDIARVRSHVAFGLGLWLIAPLLGILVARGFGLP